MEVGALLLAYKPIFLKSRLRPRFKISNFKSIQPKDHPCHVCFNLADWFQRRRLLNNFPIGPMLKLCPLTVAILNRDQGH